MSYITINNQFQHKITEVIQCENYIRHLNIIMYFNNTNLITLIT